MKATLITIGSLNVTKERIWCSDSSDIRDPVELYTENGIWNIHILRSDKGSSMFGPRNIMVAFSHQDFPYNVKQCVSKFYDGEDAISDNTWGCIRNSLPVDTGEAIFSTKILTEQIQFPNSDPDCHISWSEEGLCMNTGFGDGNYSVYTFVKQEQEEGQEQVLVSPMLIIADFMVFSDPVIVE